MSFKEMLVLLVVIFFVFGIRRWPALKGGFYGFLRELRAAKDGRSDIEISGRPAEVRPAAPQDRSRRSERICSDETSSG